MSVGIKRSGVLEILSVALVVDAQPIGWKGRPDKSMGRVGCRRERFSRRRTGHWGRSGAGRAPVSEEVKGGVGLDSGCGRVSILMEPDSGSTQQLALNEILNRVGAVLVVVGLLDIAYMLR